MILTVSPNPASSHKSAPKNGVPAKRSEPARTLSPATHSLIREEEGIPVLPTPLTEDGWETGQFAVQPSCPASPVQEIALLSTTDVAEVFGRTDRTIRRWISRGHLAPVRVGGAVFFRAEDVRRLVSGRISSAVTRGQEAVSETASDADISGITGSDKVNNLNIL